MIAITCDEFIPLIAVQPEVPYNILVLLLYIGKTG